MGIYVVTEGRIIHFQNATGAKPSGIGGVVVHIMREDEVVGNIPMKLVKFYGSELPATYKKDYEDQLVWEKLSPEEKTAARAKAKQIREGTPAPRTP